MFLYFGLKTLLVIRYKLAKGEVIILIFNDLGDIPRHLLLSFLSIAWRFCIKILEEIEFFLFNVFKIRIFLLASLIISCMKFIFLVFHCRWKKFCFFVSCVKLEASGFFLFNNNRGICINKDCSRSCSEKVHQKQDCSSICRPMEGYKSTWNYKPDNALDTKFSFQNDSYRFCSICLEI